MNTKYIFKELGLTQAIEMHNEELVSIVKSEGLNISHLPEWIHCGAVAHGYTDDTCVVVVLNTLGKVVSFVPYRLSKRTLGGVPYTALEIGAGLPGYHYNWLFGPSGKALLLYLMSLLDTGLAHALVFSCVQDDSKTASLLKESEECPVILSVSGENSPIISLSNSWDTYLASKSRNFRYNLKRKKSKFNTDGDWRIENFSKPSDISRFIDIMLDIEKYSWKATSNIAVTPNGIEHHYYTLLLPYLARNNIMAGVVLWQGDNPVAYSLRYIWNKEIGEMKSSFKEDVSRLSPGTIILLETMKDAFESDSCVFDFLGDTNQSKLQWSTGNVSHHTYYCFSRSLRGKIARTLHGIINMIRNMTKSTC